MRLIPIIITFVIMAYIPSSLYARHIMKTRRSITEEVVAAFAIPTFIILGIIFINRATLVNLLSGQFMIWSLWMFLLIYLPLNVYSVFYVINKIIKLLTHRTFKTINYIGIASAVIVAFAIIMGAATRHHIKVRETTIYSKNLPSEFDGIRIAHISDLHLGNLSPQNKYLDKIIATINKEKPNILVFTGDLLNQIAENANNVDSLFSKVDAPLGRYAVMGNHDYGDYSKWKTEADKKANLEATYETYCRLGFTLLKDSALYITIGDNKIGVIGVENWGNPPFPRYGDLSEATKAFNPAEFNILLSHDPNHWEFEVTKDKKYEYIDLTLSGHTHSAQIGVEIENKHKWSPSQWIFKYWDGLYQENNQYLYVTRGLGYVGIPFRLGMPAEISIIELKVEN